MSFLFEVAVSIPFKRETPSKRQPSWCQPQLRWLSFNSLQTGNSIQTSIITLAAVTLVVGFNSLQTGNSIQTITDDSSPRRKIGKFQFPSNGKLHPNLFEVAVASMIVVMFQFPSNGKLHPNSTCRLSVVKDILWVSIPFKRETPSKPMADVLEEGYCKW